MKSSLILGILFILALILGVFAVSALVILYYDGKEVTVVSQPSDNYKANDYEGINNVKTSDCYEEVEQEKDNGECIGTVQEKKSCYRNVVTCSGMRTETVDCYDEVEQEKGDGECIGVAQEKGSCYRNVVTCSGMRTETVDCYDEVEQEKDNGECMGVAQVRSECYKEKESESCFD